MPQAQQVAASLGVPALANVFYYGKDFGSKKQQLGRKGTVSLEKYRPLSVTKPGAAGEVMEEQEIAAKEKRADNLYGDFMDEILSQRSQSNSLEDLLKIIGKG